MRIIGCTIPRSNRCRLPPAANGRCRIVAHPACCTSSMANTTPGPSGCRTCWPRRCRQSASRCGLRLAIKPGRFLHGAACRQAPLYEFPCGPLDLRAARRIARLVRPRRLPPVARPHAADGADRAGWRRCGRACRWSITSIARPPAIRRGGGGTASMRLFERLSAAGRAAIDRRFQAWAQHMIARGYAAVGVTRGAQRRALLGRPPQCAAAARLLDPGHAWRCCGRARGSKCCWRPGDAARGRTAGAAAGGGTVRDAGLRSGD